METPDLPAADRAAVPHIVVLLVDDQAIVGAAVRRMLADEPGITLHFCQDPAAALRVARELSPHVILQDLVMPGSDGLALLREYRADESLQPVPVVVLSAREEATTKAAAFADGASDYLVKLPDRIEMVARLRHHARGYTSLLERNAAYRALWESQQLLADELREAEEYVRSLLPAPLRGAVASEWQYVPSTSLGGDAFGYHWLDEDRLAVYLLDVCGHGVGAALLSISVMNALRAMSLAGADFRRPASVLTALNAAFPMEQHGDKFFTLWYGVYDRAAGSIAYASAGHPPAVLFCADAAGAAQELRLATPGIAIGCMPDFPYEEAVQPFAGPAKLYVYSDGVYEVAVPGGGVMSLEDFVGVLRQHRDPARSDADALLAHMTACKGTPGSFDDDFSLLELRFAPGA